VQLPFDVFICQLAGLCVPAGAIMLIYKGGLFHARYRRGVLFILGIAVGLELVFLLGGFYYAEAAVRWRLRQEGMETTALIISSREAGSDSRRFGRAHLNWSHYYAATCQYTDARGARLQGSIEIPPSMPHLPGDKVSVRYLATDSSVMREDYDLMTATEPEKWPYLWLPWIGNAILFAGIYSNARARKRRAVAAGRLDFPY
jgi:hypothetical protein